MGKIGSLRWRAWPLAAALVSLFLPALAGADLMAIYRRSNSSVTLRIEVASNGDVRTDNGPAGYELWSGGKGFSVLPGPGGPLVMATADIPASRTTAPPMPAIGKPWVPVGTATIAGRTGAKYMIRGTEKSLGASALVISKDPALAPLRDVFVRLESGQSSSLPTESSPERTSWRAALATGAPIAIHGFVLAEVSQAPLPPERFRLPAAPLPAPQVRGYWAEPAADLPATPEKVKRERDRDVRRAVFAADRLWLLSESGTLSSLAPGGRTRREEAVPGTVADICAAAGGPVIVTEAASNIGVWQRAGDGWRALQTIHSDKSAFRAISCSPARIVMLTDSQVTIFESGRQRTLQLSPRIGVRSVITTLFDAGAVLYVGLDAGEWGGGLRRIDLSTGTVAKLARVEGGLCGGPLNPDCDPVNGVARAPGRPDCVLIAIGFVHFSPHGRLTEVCGDRIRRVYYKPYTVETSWPADPPEEPFATVPFFGLAEAGGTLWAVGGDGIYAIDEAGKPTFREMPPFEDAEGVAVSFAVPGLALVRSSINGSVALGGAVPMLVPL